MRFFTLCEDGSHQEYQGISTLRRSRTLISQMPEYRVLEFVLNPWKPEAIAKPGATEGQSGNYSAPP